MPSLVCGVVLAAAATPFLAVAHELVLDGLRSTPFRVLAVLPFLAPAGLPIALPAGLLGGLWLSWRTTRSSSRASLKRDAAIGGAVLGIVWLAVLAASDPLAWHFDLSRAFYFATVGAVAGWLATLASFRLGSSVTG